MEVFAVAANVMAAVSLTLQLVDTIESIKEFWKEMRNASREVEQIIGDLELLEGILDGVGKAVQLRCPDGSDPVQIASVLAALQQCQRHICRMSEFANNMRAGFTKRSLVTSFKMALRKPKVAEFSRHLEQAKTTLLLAINVASFMIEERCSEKVLQHFSHLHSQIEMRFIVQSAISTPEPPREFPKPHSQDNSNNPKKHDKIISSAGRQLCASDVLLWLLQLPPNSSYREHLQKTGRIIGRISWRSSKQQSCDAATLKTTRVISIHLPILQKSFSVASQWALGQWTHTFRVTRIVPDTASIFKLCATTNLTTIRQVFNAGKASPFDQTPCGITLLHVAAASYRYDMYQLLRDYGVEYSLCEHPQYGMLAPVELTQDFTIFAEGTYQTVQQWLTINNEESFIMNPEASYQNCVGIWNSSIETEESMTDEQIMTLLQGPLRLPRPRRCAPFDIEADTYNTGDTTLSRCSSSVLLFCYYFLFHQDPYGHGISQAWLHSRSVKDAIPVPLYEYLGQYWHGEKWLTMLGQCRDLDFLGLAQRQQDKFLGFSFAKAWDSERQKWVRRKTALFKFGEDGDKQPGIWIGTLSDCQVVFEFEEQECEDSSLSGNDLVEKFMPEAFPPVPALTSPMPKSGANLVLFQVLQLLKALAQQLFTVPVLLSVVPIYFLYLYLIGRPSLT